MIKAIETRYAGCRFRSRLEARWAVFFDHLGIRWEYEPEGFELSGENEPQQRYLPDFLIHPYPSGEDRVWVEVKGTEPDFVSKLPLYADMIDYGGALPGVGDSGANYRVTGGLLILGPIPQIVDGFTPCHSILQHRKGLVRRFINFEKFNFSPAGFLQIHNPLSGKVSDSVSGWTGDKLDDEGFPFTETIFYREEIRKTGTGWYYGSPSASVLDAYCAARAARFEHGENG